MVALAYLIDPEIPKNDGAFRPLKLKLKEGTVVWPRPGAPVTLCTNHCGQEIIEAIIRALAPACPERAMAGWGRRFRMAIQGVDPRTEKPFIWHLFQARPGGGGSSAGDGWPGAGEWQAAGGIKFGSIEVHEVRFPLHFRRHEFRPDSGGDGRYRGGPGGGARDDRSRPPSRPSAIRRATASSTAPAGCSAARTASRTATGCSRRAAPIGRSRPRRRASCCDPATCSTPIRAGAAAGASRSQRTAEERARDVELGFVSAEGR